MAQVWKDCTVDRVGPAADGGETAQPVIYLMLTAVDNTFNGQWFYAAEAAKTEMLAVALTAQSLNRRVNAAIDPPNPKGSPYTACYRLYTT
jgi:hypothetical protein